MVDELEIEETPIPEEEPAEFETADSKLEDEDGDTAATELTEPDEER
jgi:hypothetical protein